MNKMIEYEQELREVFDREAEGLKAEGPRNRAEWARIVAAEIRKQGMARSKEVTQANGEAVPQETENFLYDTLKVPDLAAVEASFERTQLLLQQGPGVAAMAVDASVSIQSRNSLEKMLAHQLAAVHQAVMEQMSFPPSKYDVAGQAKRLNAAARCMSAFQKGLLTLSRLRQGGNQRITVQYVDVRDGGQAVIGSDVRGGKRN